MRSGKLGTSRFTLLSGERQKHPSSSRGYWQHTILFALSPAMGLRESFYEAHGVGSFRRLAKMHVTKGFPASTVSLLSQQCHHTYLTVQAGCDIAAPAEDSGSSGIFINMMHRMPRLDRDPAHAARPEAPGRSAMFCDRANSEVFFLGTSLIPPAVAELPRERAVRWATRTRGEEAVTTKQVHSECGDLT